MCSRRVCVREKCVGENICKGLPELKGVSSTDRPICEKGSWV